MPDKLLVYPIFLNAACSSRIDGFHRRCGGSWSQSSPFCARIWLITTVRDAVSFRNGTPKYATYQKGIVLDFRMYLLPLFGELSSSHSVHSPSALHTFGSPQPAHRSVSRYYCGRHLGSGLVGHLEGDHLGERLGHCRERYTYFDFPPAIHFSITTGLGPTRRRADYRNGRTGCVPVAR
jgi:hypothetical protein